jgi:hypothetical protein
VGYPSGGDKGELRRTEGLPIGGSYMRAIRDRRSGTDETTPPRGVLSRASRSIQRDYFSSRFRSRVCGGSKPFVFA